VTRLSDTWPRWALLACVMMLAGAHAFETFGHMAPCELCLKQRDVYWYALGVAAAGSLLGFTRFRGVATRIANVVLALLFLLGAVVAGYHAGVEWKFWPGPAACTGGAQGVSTADLTALLNGAKGNIPQCDKPAWVFFGLSMAGWNSLVSLGLALFSAMAASRGFWPPPEFPPSE
jgi:disulfide bond formation protein DsbB